MELVNLEKKREKKKERKKKRETGKMQGEDGCRDLSDTSPSPRMLSADDCPQKLTQRSEA